MDRELMDDIYCFCQIQKAHCTAQITRIRNKMDYYNNQINTYVCTKELINDTNITRDLNYGITSNERRCIWATNMINELTSLIQNLDTFQHQYFYEDDSITNSYIEKNYLEHKHILNNTSLFK